MNIKYLGRVIHVHRKKSGLSQKGLAEIAGLGKTVIFDIEKGKLSVRFDSLLKVFEVLNIKIELHSPLMNLYQKFLPNSPSGPAEVLLSPTVKQADVFVNKVLAGRLQEIERGKKYRFVYLDGYQGDSISLEIPRDMQVWEFDRLPTFFDGVLPEGMMLEALLKLRKIDRDDYITQLIAVGEDLVGNVTIKGLS